MRSVPCGIRFVALIIGVVCALLFVPFTSWIWQQMSTANAPKAQSYTVENDPSGVGPAYPAYWVTQDYWVAEGCPVSDAIKAEAEKFLAPLDADNIAKTAVVCMQKGTVAVPGEWAKRFGKYYHLGNPDGERKDNGFVWLVLYDDTGKTEVHYAVGDGIMNKLGSNELGNVKRAAEAAYDPASTQGDNVANSILNLSASWAKVARANYEPWNPATPKYGGPITKSSDNNNGGSVLCLGLLGLFVWLVLLSEPILALGVVIFGSYSAWQFMSWPLQLLKIWAESRGNGNTGTYHGSDSDTHSSDSGKSTGGGGDFTRTR